MKRVVRGVLIQPWRNLSDADDDDDSPFLGDCRVSRSVFSSRACFAFLLEEREPRA